MLVCLSKQYRKYKNNLIPRFSGHGNSIHNIIPLLKKENVDLYPSP